MGNRSNVQAGKILRDIPRLSRNEAYVYLGLSELSHSDQILTAVRHHGNRTQSQPLLTEEASVSFENIRREEFDGFLPPHLVLERLMTEQVEWFANDGGKHHRRHRRENGQGLELRRLEKGPAGNFRVSNLGGDSFSFAAARAGFLLDMNAAEKAEEEITRQEKRKATTNRRP